MAQNPIDNLPNLYGLDDLGDSHSVGMVGDVIKFALFDGYGNPIKSLKNAINIHDADVHNSIVNQYVSQATAVNTTIATQSSVNDYQITITDPTGFATNDYIHIDTTSIETTLPKIIDVTGSVFTLDRRLDKVHLVGDIVTKVIMDMSLTGQTGTLASPQEYLCGPETGVVWHITRFLFSMVHGTAGDLGLFGNLAALTNGLLLRVYVNGQYYTLTNWKTNADMKADMFFIEFDTRSGGQGNYGTSGIGTFKDAGSVLRLDGTLGDRVEIYVQDDITAINYFTLKLQGHIEE